jgi:hypothetical protein
VTRSDIERDILGGASLLWLAWADGIEAAAASQVVNVGRQEGLHHHGLRRLESGTLVAADRRH